MFFGIDGSEDAEKFKQMGGTVNLPAEKTVAPPAVSAPINPVAAQADIGAVTSRQALPATAVAPTETATSIAGVADQARSNLPIVSEQQAPQAGNEMAQIVGDAAQADGPIGWRGRGIPRKFSSESDAADGRNYAHEFNQAAYPNQLLVSHAAGGMAGMTGAPSAPNYQGQEQALFEQAFKTGNDVRQKQYEPVVARLT